MTTEKPSPQPAPACTYRCEAFPECGCVTPDRQQALAAINHALDCLLRDSPDEIQAAVLDRAAGALQAAVQAPEGGSELSEAQIQWIGLQLGDWGQPGSLLKFARAVIAADRAALAAQPQAAQACTVCNALTVPRSATHYDAEDLAAAKVQAKIVVASLNVEPSPAEGDATPCGWFETPHGQFRANPAFKMEWPPGSLKWQVPVYLHAQPQPKGLDADALRKALAAFVSDREYVASRYGVWRDGEGESVGSFKSFDEAVAAMPELQNKYGDGLSITGWNHGVLAGSVDYRDLFSTAGTTECPICYEQGPHEHSGLEIHRHRESEAELRPLRDKRRAEILARVANIEKNYSARPRLDAAVAAVHAALAAVPCAAVGADDMLEPLIYAAITHNGTPKTVAEFEQAAANVADMLKRRPTVELVRAIAHKENGGWTVRIGDMRVGRWEYQGSVADREATGCANRINAELDGKTVAAFGCERETLGGQKCWQGWCGGDGCAVSFKPPVQPQGGA